jgi:predicted nucleic acid-binding protein
VLYLDTSVILPLFLPEPTSKAVMAFVDDLPPDELTVSHWTMVEFASVLGRHVRGGRIDGAFAGEVAAHFETLVPGTFRILPPTVADLTLAKQWLADPARGLRAGDALHLAVARNNEARLIVTFDKKMIRAGRHLGLAMSSGIEWPGHD